MLPRPGRVGVAQQRRAPGGCGAGAFGRARHDQGPGRAPADGSIFPPPQAGAGTIAAVPHAPATDDGRTAVNLSRPFILRPVATTLLTVGITLAGLFGSDSNYLILR